MKIKANNSSYGNDISKNKFEHHNLPKFLTFEIATITGWSKGIKYKSVSTCLFLSPPQHCDIDLSMLKN